MAEAGTGSLLRSEDWISVWMGTAIIALVVVGVRLQGAGLSCSDGIVMTYLLRYNHCITSMSYPLFHPRSTHQRPLVFTEESFASHFPAEGLHIEFKEGLSDTKIAEAVVAFSNSDGGVILLGVTNSGRIKGIALGGEREAKLHGLLSGLHDPGRYEIHRLTVAARGVVVIGVERRTEGFSQTHNGRILVRRGASNRALVGAELSAFVNSRSLRRFETTRTDADLSTADPNLMHELASIWGWDIAGITDRVLEHDLAARAGGQTVLTVAGALHLLRRPHDVLGKSFIEIFRYRGAGDTYDRRVEVTGPLAEQVRTAASTVLDDIGHEVVVLGVTRHDLPRLPEVVLREAITNAVAHRSYDAIGTPVRIEIRDDRVDVVSPGGLPEPVTVANIREQSAARNHEVIRVLRQYKLAEDAGSGVDMMQDVMAEHLLEPPEFVDSGDSVAVTLRITSTVTPRERAWVAELEQRGSLNRQDRLLLVHAARGQELTNAAAREVLDVDSVQARRALHRLRNQGLLVQRGTRGGAAYGISADLGPPSGLRLTEPEIEAIVMDLAREGPVTNALVRGRLGTDRVRTLSILARLVDQGRLVRRGERRGSRYELPHGA